MPEQHPEDVKVNSLHVFVILRYNRAMTYIHKGHNPTITSTDNSGKLEDWLTDQMAKSEFFHQKLHEYGLLEVAYAIETLNDYRLKAGRFQSKSLKVTVQAEAC